MMARVNLHYAQGARIF
jgi:ABC-type polysaccharide/polyol phosphate export permease